MVSHHPHSGPWGVWLLDCFFAWERFNFTCAWIIAFSLASSVSHLLEYQLTDSVPVCPSIPTCCWEHELVGDAIYRLHPCWLRNPILRLQKLPNKENMKTRYSFSSPKIATGESKLIISLPLPSGYRDPWDRFVNSICRLSPCKYHRCFLQAVSQRGFKELPVLQWSKKIAPRSGKKISPSVWQFPPWEALQ